MADSLFSNVKDDFLRYVGITRIFPEIEELIGLERSLKQVNVQVSGAITSVNRFKKDGTEAFRDLSISSQKYSQNVKTVYANTVSLTDAIYKQSMMYGTSVDTMYEMIKASSEYGRILGTDTVNALTLFQEATDFSIYTLGEHTAKMISSRRIEERETRKYLTGILAVREQYGLASNDLYDLFNITEKYANIVGVTGSKLIEHTEGMARFISTMKQAGLEASFTTDLIEKLVDPSRVEENVVLLNKLGISIRDVSMGTSMENTEMVMRNLKALSDDILSHQGRITQSRMAELHGLTLEEVTKISNMEIENQELNRRKSLINYREEMTATAQMFERAKNHLLGTISLGINKTIGGIGKLLGPASVPFAIIFGGALVRTILSRVKGVRASLTTAIEEGTSKGLSDGIRKGLMQSEGRIREHMQATAGLTPDRGQSTTADDLRADQERVYGRTTFTGSYRAGLAEAYDRKSTRHRRDTGDEVASDEVKRLYENSMLSILGKESEIAELERKRDLASDKSVRGEYEKMITELKGQLGKETEHMLLISQSAIIRTQILDQISTISTDINSTVSRINALEEENRQAKKALEIEREKGAEASYQEIEAINKIIANNEARINEAQQILNTQKSQMEGFNKTSLFGEGGLSGVISGADKGRTSIQFSIDGENINNMNREAISLAIDNAKTRSLDSAETLASIRNYNRLFPRIGRFLGTEPFKNVMGGIGNSINRILGLIPGLGGRMGLIVGGLTPVKLISTGLLSILGFLSVRVGKLIKDNKEHSETMERATNLTNSFLKSVDKMVEPVANFIIKQMDKGLDKIEGLTGRGSTNLEDATMAYIRASIDSNNKLIASVSTMTDSMDSVNKGVSQISTNSTVRGIQEIRSKA